MPICIKCQREFNNHIVVDGKQRNLQNRKYCLDCSPFGRHNTSKLHVITKTEKTCPKCHETKSIADFYRRKSDISTYCKECSCKQTHTRQRLLKIQAIEYKGGECQHCGYRRCLAALEFHHIDPSQKDFAVNTKLGSFDKIKKELDKCILLCSVCHREEHADESLFLE